MRPADPKPRRRASRRSGVVLIAMGLLCGAAALVGMPASAAQEAPESLFSYDLTAGARGYSMFYEDPTGARQGEGTVPESSSSLTTGPIGLGLASMAWPGPVASNGGTLILVLAPDAPEEAGQLNYPVRAEARSGQEPPTTKNEIPGASMVATATPDTVEAEGKVQNAAGDPGTFGPSRAYSKVHMAGATGVSESISVVEKVSLAGGAITIDSVTSTAKAATDGKTGSGEASTVVSGMTIGGQPATVGEDGVTIGEEGQPLNAVANQIAKQALSQSGAEIVLGAPTEEVDGAGATYSAPSLVITWETEGGTFGVVLGGARAAAIGAPGLDSALLGDDLPAAADAAPAPAPSGGDIGGGSTTFDDGGPPVEPGLDPAVPVEEVATPSSAGGDPQVALDGAPAAALGSPVRAVHFLLGLLASVLIAIGMRRLCDAVLAEGIVAAACPLEEGPS